MILATGADVMGNKQPSIGGGNPQYDEIIEGLERPSGHPISF
jgi:hypothetical protein